MAEKTCFVIMGFGIKTDFKTGREIDLDKTYYNIIKPVFDGLGFLCFRADDIKHSGVIDLPMYQSILKADFVIADISTLNPNVLYELGVRHAVKTHTTLVIAEKGMNYPFDINHISIDSYEHLGRAIDYDEVLRFREVLKSKVISLLKAPQVDSPLYSLLPTLKTPSFTEEEITEIKETVAEEKSTSDILVEADNAKSRGDFEGTLKLLREVRSLLPHNDFIVQRLALATYKAGLPDRRGALLEAEKILSVLSPEITTDPETLGLSGAINKRLYEDSLNIEYLEKSIWYYTRGFYIKQDYYNGINAAFLFLIKASIVQDQFQAYADYGQNIDIRRKVIDICDKLISSANFKSRDDKVWVYLSLAEAYYGLEDEPNEKIYLAKSAEVAEGSFPLQTYLEQKGKWQKAVITFKAKWLK